MIIGITGNIHTGKDVVAKMIQYFMQQRRKIQNYSRRPDMIKFVTGVDDFDQKGIEFDWQIKKYGYKLKQICALLLGCEVVDFESEEFKQFLLPDQWQENLDFGKEDWLNHRTKRTYRWLLQTVGTESIRNNIHKDTWVMSLFSEYKKMAFPNKYDTIEEMNENSFFPNWIISDLRFLNEAKAIKDRSGIIIRINRNGVGSNEHIHQSEVELNKIKYDYVIENNETLDKLYHKVSTILNHAKAINLISF